MKTLKGIKADYRDFIDSIPNQLNALKNHLDITLLEYSLEEIENIEKWYRKHHRKPNRIGLTKEEINKVCTAYLGTAYMWHFGGEWELETSKSGDFGAFQIVRYGGKDYHWVALTPYNWLFFIETKQLEERIADIFERGIDYFKMKPEFILKPVRNYQ